MLKHKGYTGTFDYDADREILCGRVIDVNAVITFQGTSVSEIKEAFIDSVDTYLETCRSRNVSPRRPFSGNIRLRIAPEVHQKAFIEANNRGESLNQFIQKALAHEIGA